jgi:hypothetical protein
MSSHVTRIQLLPNSPIAAWRSVDRSWIPMTYVASRSRTRTDIPCFSVAREMKRRCIKMQADFMTRDAVTASVVYGLAAPLS